MIMNRLILIIGITLFAIQLSAKVVNKPNPNTLWVETFHHPNDLKKWKSQGELTIVDNALTFKPLEKNVTFGRYIKIDPNYPYLQIEFTKVTALKGYRGLSIYPMDKNAEFAIKSVAGWQPGLWTINLFDFMGGKYISKKTIYLVTYMYGGIGSFKSYKMIAKPMDALLLSVDKKDKTVRLNDKIKLTVILSAKAKNVTVKIKKSYRLSEVKFNKTGFLQLTSENEGKKWVGELILPSGIAKKDLEPASLIFEATILGGKIDKIYTSNPWIIITTGN